MKKIYLSGNMSPCADYYYNWTNDVHSALSDSGYECSISAFKDPSKGRFIVRHDLARLTRCDMVVINLSLMDEAYHMTGAVVEIYEAYKQGKPVYAFTEEDCPRSPQANSPWMSEFITEEFESLDDLIYFLQFEDNL